MADPRAEDLLYKLTWADAAHLGLLLLLAAGAVAFCPNPEDFSTLGLVLLAAYSAACATRSGSRAHSTRKPQLQRLNADAAHDRLVCALSWSFTALWPSVYIGRSRLSWRPARR
jgi:hypothetical protein